MMIIALSQLKKITQVFQVKKGVLIRIKMEHDELKDKILKIDDVLINHINVSPSQYDYLKIQRDAMMTVYHILELRITDLANEVSQYEIH